MSSLSKSCSVSPHAIFLVAFFFHSSIYIAALKNISEAVKFARDSGIFRCKSSFGRATLPACGFLGNKQSLATCEGSCLNPHDTIT